MASLDLLRRWLLVRDIRRAIKQDGRAVTLRRIDGVMARDGWEVFRREPDSIVYRKGEATFTVRARGIAAALGE